MRLVDHLAKYAMYHRDRRNIATHFFGIPMIVLGIQALLARVLIPMGGNLGVNLASAITLLSLGFYFALDLRYAIAMTAFFGATLLAALQIGAQPLGWWWAGWLFFFVGGWIIQFVGHLFEGKKPAFVDDLVGLLVGPLFVVAEVGFAIGLRNEVREEIERRAGPTRNRRPDPVVQIQ